MSGALRTAAGIASGAAGNRAQWRPPLPHATAQGHRTTAGDFRPPSWRAARRGICLALCTLLVSLGLAQPGVAQSTALFVDAQAKKKTIKALAIFLTSADPLLTRLLEDGLAIELLKADMSLKSREDLEKVVAEQVARMKEAKTGGAVTALDIGRALNLDAVITGTLIMDATAPPGVSVRIATFQLLDVATGKTLMSVLFEFDGGRSFATTAKAFVDTFRQHFR